ncbi:MAG: glycosyltransferase family 4 protein [Anaerolineae bacterium]|nr:glycosyltransferase family 4 protein [Anaerolineae bacterium]
MGNGVCKAICTIFAKNYLPQVRILAESYLAHHPEGQVFGLLCDRLDGYYDPARERFVTIPVENIEVPRFTELSLKYLIVELLTAVKPFFLRHLFERYSLQQLCYLDPDILFLSPMDEVWEKLGTHNVVLTPHMVEPQRVERMPNEQTMLISGAYNLGFIGLRRSPETDRLLDWWGSKLLDQGFSDPGTGLFVDQRWMDLVPGMFEGVYIHRDPGCNVAYWNLTERPIVQENGRFFAAGRPVVFFHFSGYSHKTPERITRHVPPQLEKLTMGDLGDGAMLFQQYCDLLIRHGANETEKWPYAFDKLPDGVPIPWVARRAWREGIEAGILREDAAQVYLAFLNEPVDDQQPVINRLADWIYRNRSDVRQAFPDARGLHRRQFVRWFVETGVKEHDIPLAMYAGMQRSLLETASPAERRVQPLRPLLVGLRDSRLFRAAMSLRPAQVAGSWWHRARQDSTRSSPSPSPCLPEGLNVIGYLSAETGVGEVPRGVIRALQAHGYPVAITHLDNPDGARRDDRSVLSLPTGTPFRANFIAVNADMWLLTRQSLGSEVLKGRKNIACWMWELSRFPQAWRDRFTDLDEIWVATSFVQQAVGLQSPIPVITMGASVVLRQAAPLSRAELGLPEGRFIFLYVFDMLSIPERKNPLAVVEAYRLAFEPHFEGVHLVLKANHLTRFPEWQERLRTAVAAVNGTLIEETMDRSHLNALFQLSDAYVSLHRSEGFGLTVAEAMRMGKPVIATDYGGTHDFLNQSNGYPVRYRLVELERDYGPYQAGNVWADPDVEHAAELMRWVLNNPEDRARRGQQAAQDIEQRYGAQAFGQRVIERLRLCGEIGM